jgi:hypothetical protein
MFWRRVGRAGRLENDEESFLVDLRFASWAEGWRFVGPPWTVQGGAAERFWVHS